MFSQTDNSWICFRKRRKRSKSVDMFTDTDNMFPHSGKANKIFPVTGKSGENIDNMFPVSEKDDKMFPDSDKGKKKRLKSDFASGD